MSTADQPLTLRVGKLQHDLDQLVNEIRGITHRSPMVLLVGTIDIELPSTPGVRYARNPPDSISPHTEKTEYAAVIFGHDVTPKIREHFTRQLKGDE